MCRGSPDSMRGCGIWNEWGSIRFIIGSIAQPCDASVTWRKWDFVCSPERIKQQPYLFAPNAIARRRLKGWHGSKLPSGRGCIVRPWPMKAPARWKRERYASASGRMHLLPRQRPSDWRFCVPGSVRNKKFLEYLLLSMFKSAIIIRIIGSVCGFCRRGFPKGRNEVAQ